MDREEFMKAKQEEIQQEVDFLRKEKVDAYREAYKLYDEIIDKVNELQHCVKKEELVNKRIKSIDEVGPQIYGVYVDYRMETPYSINRSLVRLDSLAKSKFDIEEFGGLLEEKEKEKPIEYKTTAAMQRESNQLLSDMVRLLGEMKKDNELKSTVINPESLSEALSSQYRGL